MAVQIGDKPLADFSQPIQMLKDCHRRIEHFLAVLKTALARFGEGELTAEGRRALEAALGYFANFAPRHTADEEESLFPRLRRCDGPEASAALAEIKRLEEDHRWSETCHALVDRLVRFWLAAGRLDKAERATLRQALDDLTAVYAGHIRCEEEQVFVLAERLLDSNQLQEIGAEMKRRRG